jgi:prefoldin subunit 5
MLTQVEMQKIVDQINSRFDYLNKELEKLRQELQELKPKTTKKVAEKA